MRLPIAAIFSWTSDSILPFDPRPFAKSSEANVSEKDTRNESKVRPKLDQIVARLDGQSLEAYRLLMSEA